MIKKKDKTQDKELEVIIRVSIVVIEEEEGVGAIRSLIRVYTWRLIGIVSHGRKK